MEDNMTRLEYLKSPEMNLIRKNINTCAIMGYVIAALSFGINYFMYQSLSGIFDAVLIVVCSLLIQLLQSGKDYIGSWEHFNIFSLKAHNPEPTIRAYSMANYPAEGDRITLTVRIATTPFKPKPEVGFQDVPTGIASSYIFSRKPGDKVIMSGPYGDFHPIFDSKKEMIWVGGGAGMAPLRAQIMHMTKTLQTRDREMHFFYGARALVEAFFIEDFLALEKEFPNFHFHLALDRPDPAADEAGVKYTAGFVHQVMYETYLKDHEAPEDIEYYMCGPGPMSKAVQGMLDSLGVEPESIMFDNFG